jgi:hypothetical protein
MCLRFKKIRLMRQDSRSNGLEQERYSKLMIDLVREELKFDLSKQQIDLYKSKKLHYLF